MSTKILAVLKAAINHHISRYGSLRVITASDLVSIVEEAEDALDYEEYAEIQRAEFTTQPDDPIHCEDQRPILGDLSKLGEYKGDWDELADEMTT